MGGISTVAYSPTHSLLFVGGGAEPVTRRDTEMPSASQLGITAWRTLSDIPHYKLVTDYDDIQMVINFLQAGLPFYLQGEFHIKELNK